MQIILMRHGRTAANLKKLYNGSTDDPLCPEGIEHAQSTGSDTTVEMLYASPMKRALQTAKIKFPNAHITVNDALREMDFGDFEGRCYEQLKDDAAYIKWQDSGATLPCPNGENITDFGIRVCRAFDEIVQTGIAQGTKKLVIVAHGGSLMSICGRYGQPERPYYEWHVGNCCGYRAQIDETTWAVSPALTSCELFEAL